MMNLTNNVLIASPSMTDIRFAQSVIYIARHDDEGAFGFVINKQLDVNMFHILEDLNIINTKKPYLLDMPVLDGGPVNSEVGFILHTGLPKWESSVAIAENICFTTSKDILEAIAYNNSVTNYHMCLGHANWQKQQLEAEIQAGDWFTLPANSELLFKIPLEERWQHANLLVGIDVDWLITDIGNA